MLPMVVIAGRVRRPPISEPVAVHRAGSVENAASAALRRLLAWCLLVMPLAMPLGAAEESVSVLDSGAKTHPGTWECKPGHPIETRSISLENSVIRYSFGYSGCLDPSHGEERPSSEGNFGMPSPTRCNFYAGGFIGVIINGKDAVRHRVISMQTLERGGRGEYQALFAHPDATVGLRLVLLPGSNHVLLCVGWVPNPGATLGPVTIRLTCYPSFFTTFHHRQGERHCRTPRTDEQQVNTLTLQPADDSWLYYYDTVFDVARGEGDGPCAVLTPPEGWQAGRVVIGDYSVVTTLDYDPAAGQARLGLYDFAGLTNAAALEYLEQHGAADLAELRQLDFRPTPLQTFDAARFRADTERLLAAAGDDGERLRPQVEALLAGIGGDPAGDWAAEAELASRLEKSEDLLWELRIFALLNAPPNPPE